LHRGILPKHRGRGRMMTALRYVVLDEAHVYRGVFGSHVANVLRRLRRLCAHYGSDPTFILCSATIANAGELAERLSKVTLSSTVTVGEDDQVFGSVTSQVIAELLKENGFEISKKDILLEEPLKALGEFAVDIKLGHGVTGTITVWVIKE
ncbi:MAG: DEAD/DEAH box helicase, partial [Candidatus Marinimicrobia bacterium]|nr:DEAD/DEAH box helicase [Candidatus Neomarinimicrobiota bacterium]